MGSSRVWEGRRKSRYNIDRACVSLYIYHYVRCYHKIQYSQFMPKCLRVQSLILTTYHISVRTLTVIGWLGGSPLPIHECEITTTFSKASILWHKMTSSIKQRYKPYFYTSFAHLNFELLFCDFKARSPRALAPGGPVPAGDFFPG